MKSMLVLLSIVFSNVGWAATPNLNISCSDIEIFTQDDSGKGSFQKTDFIVSVYPSSAGKFGYEAKITSANGQLLEQDVKADVLTQPSREIASLKELVDFVLPNVDFAEVSKVHHGNVGVTVNQVDSAGVHIFELYGQNGTLLGKLIQVGWSFGRCL